MKATEQLKKQSVFMQMHNGTRTGEGSFNVALKELFYKADLKNRRKLVKAFPDFFGNEVPEFGINRQDDIQKQPQNTSCNKLLGRDFLEILFSKPLLQVSRIEIQDPKIRRILGNLREIQDGVQMAGLTLLKKDRHIYSEHPEVAVEEALRFLSECAIQISDDLLPLIKRLSQHENHMSYENN